VEKTNSAVHKNSHNWQTQILHRLGKERSTPCHSICVIWCQKVNLHLCQELLTLKQYIIWMKIMILQLQNTFTSATNILAILLISYTQINLSQLTLNRRGKLEGTKPSSCTIKSHFKVKYVEGRKTGMTAL
jgi:hypothetical protein